MIDSISEISSANKLEQVSKRVAREHVILHSSITERLALNAVLRERQQRELEIASFNVKHEQIKRRHRLDLLNKILSQ
jgi:hypothetical protein